MMNSAAIALCMALFASVAGGATVEILTEGWTGSGNTNGWKFANLGSDGAMGAESFIESPKWTDADILSAMVSVRCSTNQPDRIPQITFCYDEVAAHPHSGPRFPMENITASRDLSPWNYQSLANRSSEVTNPETSLDQALCDMGKSVTMTT